MNIIRPKLAYLYSENKQLWAFDEPTHWLFFLRMAPKEDLVLGNFQVHISNLKALSAWVLLGCTRAHSCSDVSRGVFQNVLLLLLEHRYVSIVTLFTGKLLKGNLNKLNKTWKHYKIFLSYRISSISSCEKLQSEILTALANRQFGWEIQINFCMKIYV